MALDPKIITELASIAKTLVGTVRSVQKAEEAWEVVVHCGVCSVKVGVAVHKINGLHKLRDGQYCPKCNNWLQEHTVRPVN